MSMELEQSVPGASLDDHRTWVDRLTNHGLDDGDDRGGYFLIGNERRQC